MADIDYSAVVRKLKTSDLIAVMTTPDACRALVDPDGALDARIIDIENPRFREDEEEFLARAKAAVLACGAELDRRIPIPEGP